MEILIITGNRTLGENTVKRLLLEKPYWNVTFCNSGAEARKVILQNNFDAAIVEVFSSNGTGFDMISELSVTYPSLPVIAVSSSFSNGVIEKAEMYCDRSYVCNISDIESCINTVERACV